MIQSFGSRETEYFYYGATVQNFSDIAPKARHYLSILDGAQSLQDLESLYSVTLTEQDGTSVLSLNERWSLCFVWSDVGPHDVIIVRKCDEFSPSSR